MIDAADQPAGWWYIAVAGVLAEIRRRRPYKAASDSADTTSYADTGDSPSGGGGSHGSPGGSNAGNVAR